MNASLKFELEDYSNIYKIVTFNILVKECHVLNFDVFEIHEAFAGQVLANLEAMNSDKFCQERVGVKSKAGEIPMDKVEKI